MSEKESKPFYHTAAWKRLRQVALMRDGGMCQDCMQRLRDGISVRPHRAEMVHHIIPVEERPDLALNLNNLRSLCNECHNRRHPEKGGHASKEEEVHHQMRVIRV